MANKKESLIQYGERTDNKVDKYGKITCACGSRSIEPTIFKDDVGDHTWVKLRCRHCRQWIFYNGA